MAPRSSTTVIVRSPARRHLANNRSAIIKTTSMKHIQPSSLHIKNLDIQKLKHINKTKQTLAMSRSIASIPSIAVLLDACYALDHLICTCTPVSEIQNWHSLDPWEYLASDRLVSKWRISLESICQDFLSAKLTPDAFEAKLMSHLPGLKNLEVARERVAHELEGELNARGVWVVIPDAFWEAVEKRVDVVTEVFEEMGGILDDQ